MRLAGVGDRQPFGRLRIDRLTRRSLASRPSRSLERETNPRAGVEVPDWRLFPEPELEPFDRREVRESRRRVCVVTDDRGPRKEIRGDDLELGRLMLISVVTVVDEEPDAATLHGNRKLRQRIADDNRV